MLELKGQGFYKAISTLHLDQKYTPEEARYIFEVVRGFMMRVAVRMDQDGQPPV